MGLSKRVWAEMNRDRIFDSAASLAYYLLLAIFPLLISVVSLMSLVTGGGTTLLDSLLTQAGRMMPADAFRLIAIAARKIEAQSNGGLITIGLIGTLWSASSGIASIMDSLNVAYEVRESRSFVKRRAISLALTIGLTVLATIGAGLLVASDKIGILLEHVFPYSWTLWAGAALSVCSGLLAMVAGFGFIHYFGPNVHDARRAFLTPGSLIGILLFLIASFALSIYLRISGGFSSSLYGAFGGVIVLLLWLYFLGLAILIGGEVNSEIAKANA